MEAKSKKMCLRAPVSAALHCLLQVSIPLRCLQPLLGLKVGHGEGPPASVWLCEQLLASLSYSYVKLGFPEVGCCIYRNAMGNSKAEQWENGLFAGSPWAGELGGAVLCGEGGFSPSKLRLLGAPPSPQPTARGCQPSLLPFVLVVDAFLSF